MIQDTSVISLAFNHQYFICLLLRALIKDILTECVFAIKNCSHKVKVCRLISFTILLSDFLHRSCFFHQIIFSILILKRIT